MEGRTFRSGRDPGPEDPGLHQILSGADRWRAGPSGPAKEKGARPKAPRLSPGWDPGALSSSDYPFLYVEVVVVGAPPSRPGLVAVITRLPAVNASTCLRSPFGSV